VYFNLRNILPQSGTFLLGHPVYTTCVYIKSLILPTEDICIALEVLVIVMMVQLRDIYAVWASNYHLTLHNVPEDTAVRTSNVTAVISLNSLKGLVQ